MNQAKQQCQERVYLLVHSQSLSEHPRVLSAALGPGLGDDGTHGPRSPAPGSPAREKD